MSRWLELEMPRVWRTRIAEALARWRVGCTSLAGGGRGLSLVSHAFCLLLLVEPYLELVPLLLDVLVEVVASEIVYALPTRTADLTVSLLDGGADLVGSASLRLLLCKWVLD